MRNFLLLLGVILIHYTESVTHDEAVVKYIEAYQDLSGILANDSSPPDWFQRLPGYECSIAPRWPQPEEHFTFPCDPIARSPTRPTSVHYLRPGDIDVIGAMGDSITSANGAGACFLPELAYMYRGRCFSSGADESYATNPSLANILLKYNPNLKGYSLRTNWWTAPEAGFNVAIPGAVADDMPEQAHAIVRNMQRAENFNYKKAWKLITIFIGGNDLCAWCRDKERWSPENFANYIKQAIKIIHDGLPRTFVNVVGVIQVHQVSYLTGTICDFFHNSWCKCAVDEPDDVLEATRAYHKAVEDMVNAGQFEEDDFTVVVQPFLQETNLPRTKNDEIDTSYFAPDCFHFSNKAHAYAGISLWNNMNQPVGQKDNYWTLDNPKSCPTKEFPYLYTKVNSEPEFDVGGEDSATSIYPVTVSMVMATVAALLLR